jgi:hypothetical protein
MIGRLLKNMHVNTSLSLQVKQGGCGGRLDYRRRIKIA